MFNISKETILSPEMIKKFIEAFKAGELPRLIKLYNYYMNNTKIKQRVFTDTTKPNNKIAHNWAGYITDTMTAFFMGEPVSYSGDDKDVEELNAIFNYNDEQDINSRHAKNASIYGVSYELTYLDEDAQLRLAVLNPANTIAILDDTVNENLLYVIRFSETTDILTSEVIVKIEVYDNRNITYYMQKGKEDIYFVYETTHNFNDIPISIYKNNDEMIGDYENEMDLIDFYDIMQSDTANAFDYYNDCYMIFSGGSLPDDVESMKEQRIIELPEGATAEFLVKPSDDLGQENTKNRIVNDIHKFSKVPNLSDKEFANNVSGVAMKYKLIGLENTCSIKERKFKKGLQNRLWLISDIKKLKTATGLQDIKISFKRNIPQNEVEIAQMINTLRGLISAETLINQLTFVENAAEEIEKLSKENEINSYSDTDGDNNFEGGDNEEEEIN